MGFVLVLEVLVVMEEAVVNVGAGVTVDFVAVVVAVLEVA